MAKKKRSRVRRTRTSASRKAPKRRKSKTFFSGLTGQVLAAGVYGAARERVSDMLVPVTSRIPAGNYADEVGMGLLNYALATGKIPFINKINGSRNVGKAGLMIEAARVGATLMDNGFSGFQTTGTSGPALKQTIA